MSSVKPMGTSSDIVITLISNKVACSELKIVFLVTTPLTKKSDKGIAGILSSYKEKTTSSSTFILKSKPTASGVGSTTTSKVSPDSI